ncbi:MAG: enoyl-CoA hydratase-related protein [Vicinamibacterales bacterium]
MSCLQISHGPVTTVTLHRPEVRNAFNEALIAELRDFARGVPDDGSVRVVVIQGAGSVFCAGADLQWMSKMIDYSEAQNLADAREASQMLLALDSMPVPLVGRVHGAAMGGGAGLAAICDVVVAAEDAMFGFTEVTLGILPAMISPYVVRKIGLSNARELCLNGARFTATRAKEIGLVHDVVHLERLDLTVDRHVQQFLRAAPGAVAATKRLLGEVHGRQPADVLDATAAAIAKQRVSPEGQEGMRAFLERRAAAWTEPGKAR